MNLRAWHHGYIGVFSLAIAWLAISKSDEFITVVVYLFSLFGLWMIADDIYQHNRQRKEPAYRSPVHRLYGKITRWLP